VIVARNGAPAAGTGHDHGAALAAPENQSPGGLAALILNSMFRFAAALTLAVASALAAALAPAAAFGGLRG
jgi:hypothetical protein